MGNNLMRGHRLCWVLAEGSHVALCCLPLSLLSLRCEGFLSRDDSFWQEDRQPTERPAVLFHFEFVLLLYSSAFLLRPRFGLARQD